MDICKEIIAIAEEAKSWRRLLHQNPQTAYEEVFASNFVTEKLK